jgi:hypothetical protein
MVSLEPGRQNQKVYYPQRGMTSDQCKVHVGLPVYHEKILSLYYICLVLITDEKGVVRQTCGIH